MWRSPTEIGTGQHRRTKSVTNPCSVCNEEVHDEDKALNCDLCDTWEHQDCIRQADRLSEELYHSITHCNNKSIVIVCTACRHKGSLGKRLLKYELESARVNEQLLASERLLEERQRTIERLLEDKRVLLSERDKLSDELSGMKKLPSLVSETEEVVSPSSETDDRVQSSDEHSVDSEHSAESRRPPRRGSRLVQPPGFREIRSRVGTFSGRKGEDDFSLWLTDFEEATTDFTWSDNARVRWFSWFIEGPAKATWQRTLTSKERGSWTSTKKIFQGQYGIHMDPRTAYQRCHELQYEELGSVQALLEAMREYQRLAPEKLSDANLESILWNKVPVVLQKEVGEMKEWSLQELFQRLLKAEARVQERERRQQPVPNQSGSATATVNRRSFTTPGEK